MGAETRARLLDVQEPYVAMRRLEPGHESCSMRDMHLAILDNTSEMRQLTAYTKAVNQVTALEAVRFMSDAISGHVGSNVAQRQRTAGGRFDVGAVLAPELSRLEQLVTPRPAGDLPGNRSAADRRHLARLGVLCSSEAQTCQPPFDMCRMSW
jgi:hypothetical protein